jgi:hypothetical protein
MHIATLRKLAKSRGFEIEKADKDTCAYFGGACYYLSFVAKGYRYTQEAVSAAACARTIEDDFKGLTIDECAVVVRKAIARDRGNHFQMWSRSYVGTPYEIAKRAERLAAMNAEYPVEPTPTKEVAETVEPTPSSATRTPTMEEAIMSTTKGHRTMSRVFIFAALAILTMHDVSHAAEWPRTFTERVALFRAKITGSDGEPACMPSVCDAVARSVGLIHRNHRLYMAKR